MERAEYLLLKMLEQLRRNESKAQLLDSLRGLQEEIERSFPAEEPAPEPIKAPEVAPVPEPVAEVLVSVPPVEETPIQEDEKVFEVLQINEEEIDWELEENPMVIDIDDEDDEEEPAAEPQKEVNIAQTILSKFLTPPPVDALLNPDFVEEKEQPKQEPVSVTVKRNTESSAEQKTMFPEQNAELLSRYAEAPIKDLKKAIGINDRYQFIQELFKGDETMYERSIKTINDFSIFPEAEFWIRRELKTKLGWNAEDPLVIQFDQLVRRRFS